MKQSIWILLLFLSTIVHGQRTEKEAIVQARIEFLSEELESEELDLTDVIAQLNYYYDSPLNLNHADVNELRELSLLTEIQVSALLLHRKMFGKFISIYELQSVAYWDLQTIRMVLPFIKVDDKLDQLHLNVKEIAKHAVFETYLRYQTTLEQKEGYDEVPDSILNTSNSYYHGNADRYYARMRYSYRTNLSFGITAEKDPGEEFFNGSQQQGFDFYSAHAFFKGGKYLKGIAIGDYQVQIGQGLNIWSGYAFRKTADVVNVKRSAIPLKPYTSVDEFRYLRGAAFEVGIGKWSLLNFGSQKKVDGTPLLDSLADEELAINSINISGLHRTNSELARKGTFNESIFGSNLRFESRSFQAGVAAVYQGYDYPLEKNTLPYNQFEFSGKNTTNVSADYNFVLRNVNFFGEIAYASYSKSMAFVQGMLISLDRRAALSMVYRNYDKSYHAFYNAGFAESSRAQNERGLYTGLRLNLSKSIEVQSYVDLFTFPWLKYQIDKPSSGHEYLIQPSYKPNRSLEIYVRFREQSKAENSRTSDGSISQIEQVIQRNYRLNVNYKVSESIRFKSRIEYVTIERPSAEKQEGFIITQDIIYSPKSSPIDISLRYALFDTDSYDTRIYTYENNALYTFSIPAYYYQGSRAYILVRYQFLRHFDLWVRVGRSIFNNRSSIGSGAEMSLGNTRTDITVQLRFKL